jgi:hypothetical protein
MTARQGSLALPVRCHYAGELVRRPQCSVTAEVRYGDIALCSSCAAARSSVGKATTPMPLPPAPQVDVLGWIADAHAAVTESQRQLAAAVSRARAAGHTWTAVAGQLGISRQAAQQRFSQPAGGHG